MPHDILNSMRSLREDMRQRLLQVPEYRALVALDRSIDEICAILHESMAMSAAPQIQQESLAPPPPPRQPAPVAQMAQMAPESSPQPVATAARHAAIATAFAETLAAKLDQRNGVRPAAPYPAHRAQGV